MEEASSGFESCKRQEKEIVAGLCLSFDLLKGICMETSLPCEIEAGGELETEA
ncbi:hypothetical protein JCM30471_07140 [Desulfuromonas carbonis]|uniref:hypothetical protein n=1 Tax=Desulfuromonas sp. DDH964 TaxID=1823759 RepID=UPI00078C4F54|nr:hypothetical protein [Desulfuromonas sp. DDH964]AMV72230.1 hypothetical protein DBW_1876 [Desulfuromonas sp. DDH964]